MYGISLKIGEMEELDKLTLRNFSVERKHQVRVKVFLLYAKGRVEINMKMNILKEKKRNLTRVPLLT